MEKFTTLEGVAAPQTVSTTTGHYATPVFFSGHDTNADGLLDVTIQDLGGDPYWVINGIDVCGRVSPDAGAREGQRMRLAANVEHMHLIDETSGRVI